MMEHLRATALLGTSRESVTGIHTGTEIDPVLAAISADDRERQLLLTAGALAVWQRAGYQPAPAPAPDKAPPDTLPGCSDKLSEIFRQMLRRGDRQLVVRRLMDRDAPRAQTGLAADHDDLLPEALELLRARGLRPRYHLLPDVLPARTEELRAVLHPVIGERGRWLAGFNPAWVWATASQPSYAEWLWQNGKVEYRVDLLTSQRRYDPAGARARLETRIAADRSEVGLTLLDALEVGLSMSDESFLEGVLDAGSPAVRRRASRLLSKLPQSACAQRLRERADTMLVGNTRAARRQKVRITLPGALDPTWQREGLEAVGDLPGVDAPGYRLIHTVGLVPVRHWIDRFGVPLEELLASLEVDRVLEVLEAWTQAAVLHGEQDLMPALWDAWWQQRKNPMRTANLLVTMWSDLARAMEASALGERLVRMLADPPASETACGRVLGMVPWPWPESVSDAWLQVLQEVVGDLAAGTAPVPARKLVLLTGARGIPTRCIEPALGALASLPVLEAALNQWQPLLDLITEKLRIRQQFSQELGR